MNDTWRIEELAQLCARALKAGRYDGQHSARVREVPEKRTIRYYTTLGMLDRPLQMRGRTAFYGLRHLLQLICIKRLQASGLSLVEVQRSMAGADDKSLSQWADLPKDFFDSLAADEVAGQRPPPPDQLLSEQVTKARRSAQQFWTTEPATASADAAQQRSFDHEFAVRLGVSLPLGRGVTLLLDGIHPDQIDKEKMIAIKPGVQLLVDLLYQTGLTRAASAESGDSL